MLGEQLAGVVAHHCQVLESMFPDWTAEQLFQPYNGSINFVPKSSAKPIVDRPAASSPAAAPARDTKDVVAVYPTRSEFVHEIPPHLLFDGAEPIRIAGLSLNLLCQNYPDKALRKLLESGTTVECLSSIRPATTSRAANRRRATTPAGCPR